MLKRKKKVIIIGGGTAGLTIYSDLRKYFHVTVFDKASIEKVSFFYRVPLFIGLLFSKKNKYVSKIEIPAHDGRLIPFYESRCLGGASVINGTVHVVGDLKVWKKVLKAKSAGFHEYFNKIYNATFTKRREKWKIRLKEQKADSLDKAFYKALKHFSVVNNGTEFFGPPSCGPIINTVNAFTRSSVLDFLPFMGKSVVKNTHVDDIEIENGIVKGVRVKGQLIEADAVVLSAGVVGTNILLSKILNERGAYKTTPRNMSHIQDHSNVRINVRTKTTVFSLNSLKLPFLKKIGFLIKENKQLRSILRGSGASSAANVDLYGEGQISLRLNLLRFYESGRFGSAGELFDSSEPGFSLSLTHINPKSQGLITGNGSIKPNYLSAPEDVHFLKDALVYAVNLLQTPPFSNYVEEIIGFDEILSNPLEYIRKNYYSGYHLIGGGADLIGSEFQVKGVQGLYICDASTLSAYPTSNIHSSVVICAKIFSDKFVERHWG